MAEFEVKKNSFLIPRCKKILNTRLFEQDGKRWMQSVKDQQLEILSISQFTLYYKLKGNKPDFHHAMSGEKANELYNKLLYKLGTDYDPSKIKDGVFGAMMEVTIQNSGPVTIEIESPPYKYTAEQTVMPDV